MEVGKLTVELRSDHGKGAARRLRAQGKVPGICYGKGVEPVLISLDAKALRQSLDPVKRQNTVISMTVKGPAGDQVLTVMLKDYQLETMRREVEHVDLLAIDVNKEVRVEVPVSLTGKPIGVVDGGQLHIVYRNLPVMCKPADIPVKIEADVSGLRIGDVLHVSELKLPAGVKAAVAGIESVASVVAPQVEKEVKPVEALAVEGAAPGAAPADAKAGDAKAGDAKGEKGGDKGGDKKEAGKPAKEGKK